MNFNRVVNHRCECIWEGDCPQTFLYRKNLAHCPLELGLRRVRVGEHAEIGYTANNDVILFFVGSKVIIAGPQASQDDLLRCLLLREPGLELNFSSIGIEERNSLVHHILRLDISPDSEQQIVTFLSQLDVLFQSQVTFSRSTTLISLNLCDFLS